MYIVFNRQSHTETDVMELITYEGRIVLVTIYYASLCSVGVSESVHTAYLPENIQH